MVLIVIYGAAALASPIDIGHRHLLVLYPPLLILCGSVGLFWEENVKSSKVLQWTLVSLLGWSAVSTALAYPDYLAFFNGFAGGTSGAYRHLVDSSLDWGQDLPALKDYLERTPGLDPVRVAYFGTASPEAYRVPATLIYGYPGYDVTPPVDLLEFPEDEAQERLAAYLRQHLEYELVGGGKRPDGTMRFLIVKSADALRLSAGTYAISASLLQPVMFRSGRPDRPRGTGRYEATYQSFSTPTQSRSPLSHDAAERGAALRSRPPSQWKMLSILFRGLYTRFARLTAYLRKREPLPAFTGRSSFTRSAMQT